MVGGVLMAVAFVLAFAALCAWLLFPGLAERVSEALRRVRARLDGWRRPRPGRRAAAVATAVGDLGDSVSRHRWVLVAALLLLVVPPLLILSLRRHVVLEDFQGEDLSESRTMIAQLLRGERLLPPPPPPPEVFTTAEIRRERPEVVTADRRWERIDPALQQRVLAIYEVMRRQYGYEMVLVEGYRSPERQAELMGAGKATRAGAWQSCHQYGLAVDSAPIRDGRLQWDMGDEWTRRGYHLYGELARQAGLEWGGDWRSIKDYVHVEMASACRAARAARRAGQAQG
ncbi:M15 family metallopeptidase [[Pseudomonas] boreopolis]|uniref:D-alanyl-D-alanine carboxypeptidase n=1 Tax=Xanthomonas boreopolis TaxID=86183 RepID=A0A919FCA4_9XANT|nr:D-alanyl-D-alanine carboxypeptidase [[Pseudomonas] boreopolis]